MSSCGFVFIPDLFAKIPQIQKRYVKKRLVKR